jgi:lipid-A-disaccharide synthase
VSTAETGRGGDLVFVIAGEPSGDALGARLMAALTEASAGSVRFAGIGGTGMAAQGLKSLFPMEDLAVIGLVEVVPRIPRLVRRLRETVAAIERLRPAAVVTIDAPGFCFRVAARLKAAKAPAVAAVPVIHYVAPQVWAWLPGRTRRMARILDHLLVLLPFEEPIFEKVGLPCTYVGHPVLESGADRGDGTAFRVRHGIPADAPVVCLLPGSRQGEAKRLLPVFGGALAYLAAAVPGLHAVAAATAAVAPQVAEAAAAWPVPATVVRDDERFDGFAAGDVALAASGTVTLELALARVPMVVAYRLNPLTGWVARRLVTVQYTTLVNLILDRGVVPELLLGDCRADRVAAAALRLLRDERARAEQLRAATEALDRLGRGGPNPSRRAATVVLAVIAAASREEEAREKRTA